MAAGSLEVTPFRFVLMTLTAYRLTRLVVHDDWPPTHWFREKLTARTGQDSGWTVLFTCPWCFGVYVTAAMFLVDHYLWTIPTLLLMMGSAMAVVGYLGTYDSRD